MSLIKVENGNKSLILPNRLSQHNNINGTLYSFDHLYRYNASDILVEREFSINATNILWSLVAGQRVLVNFIVLVK